MQFGREIRLGTSFDGKYLMSVQCAKTKIENEFGVRVIVQDNSFDSSGKRYNIDIYGRDEDRVVKAFISIVNEFPNVFKSENTNAVFSTSITTFEEILNDPRSFGMGLTWFC